MKITFDQIESLRDIRFRRTKALQILNEDQALDFVNDVGFCFAFTAKNSELPCLWHAATGERSPAYPEHTHHDPYISLVWQTKDTLVAKRQIYYGKVLKKRPTMISLEYFPYFYALLEGRKGPDSYLVEYMRGELSSAAKRIMEALLDRSPQITADLKLACGLALPQKRNEFNRAMAELQMKMYVAKIAEFYDPFTFLWELVFKHFKDQVDAASSISPDEAQQKILTQYFNNLFVSNISLIQRLFGWEKGIISAVIEELIAKGVLREDINVAGERRPWVGVADIERYLPISKQT